MDCLFALNIHMPCYIENSIAVPGFSAFNYEMMTVETTGDPH
jgi:hypothetical protein